MTDPNTTLIAALLDRSGSMERCAAATEDGWRELVAEQRAEPGHCQVTLAQFDTDYELLYPPTDIAAVPEFVVAPRGGTALLDAAGRFITEVGAYLAGLPEQRRPGRVVCLIMTDGHENASRQWDLGTVRDLITQQREVYGWEFVFLGATIDAVDVAARMGVDRDKAMAYAAGSYDGNRRAYQVTSSKIAEARRGEQFGFTDSERAGSRGE